MTLTAVAGRDSCWYHACLPPQSQGNRGQAARAQPEQAAIEVTRDNDALSSARDAGILLHCRQHLADCGAVIELDAHLGPLRPQAGPSEPCIAVWDTQLDEFRGKAPQ